MADATDPATINEILKQLKEQLGVAFASPSGGRTVNIFELENLLSTLINLHERYAACDGEQHAGVTNDSRQPTVIVELKEPKQGPKEDRKIATEHLTSTFVEDPESVRILSARDESSQAIVNDKAGDQGDGNFDVPPHIPSEAIGDRTTNDDEQSIAEGHSVISDGGVGSATSSNSNSSLFSSNAEGDLQSQLSKQASVGSIIDCHCLADYSCESKIGSSACSYDPSGSARSSSKERSTKDESSVPVADCLAMLEGCKNHLELLREEIVSLNSRYQAQHEQSVQFASSLDGMVERFAAHDPKLNKLETDTHCLGMLVSDYEVEFEKIKKHLERHDGKLREVEWTFQRMDRERDAAKAELRGVTEQLNDLGVVKADKEFVQMELNLRALIADMERRVPFDQHNATIRDMSRTLTQLQEQFNDVDENLKTIQYQLVKGLGDKASAIDLNEIRRQLAGLSSRWHKMEKSMNVPNGQSPLCSGDSIAAGISVTGINVAKANEAGMKRTNCLTCGIPSTLDASRDAVPLPKKFLPTVGPRNQMVRGAGGPHTKSTAPEKVFRAVSECVVQPAAHKDHDDLVSN